MHRRRTAKAAVASLGPFARQTPRRKAEERFCLLATAFLTLAATGFAETYTVKVEDDAFEPKFLTIAPGDTVVWINSGGSAHTVVADDGSFSSTAGGQSSIPAGQTFTFTFPTAGRNPYYCQLHGGPGGQDMSGVIRVSDVTLNDPPTTPSNTAPVNGATGQSSAPTLLASAFSDPNAGDVHVSSQWVLRKVGSVDAPFDTGEDKVHKSSLPLVGLEAATVYAWKVRYRDDVGAWSPYSTETQFSTITSVAPQGTGLSGTYGSYIRQSNAVTVLGTRLDPTVNFDWGLGEPQKSTPANKFFVRWEGTILPEFSERYRFRIRADGGVRLWINGQAIIEDWVTGPFPLYRNNVADLQAGVPATIRLEYFDALGNASVSLRWSSRSQNPQVIPQSRLFPLQP